MNPIAKFRKDWQLTQKEAGEVLSCSQSRISHWESEDDPLSKRIEDTIFRREHDLSSWPREYRSHATEIAAARDLPF